MLLPNDDYYAVARVIPALRSYCDFTLKPVKAFRASSIQQKIHRGQHILPAPVPLVFFAVLSYRRTAAETPRGGKHRRAGENPATGMWFCAWRGQVRCCVVSNLIVSVRVGEASAWVIGVALILRTDLSGVRVESR